MVEFFALQIRMRKITLEDVPEKWRQSVAEKLNRQTA